MSAIKLYTAAGHQIEDATESQMFGKPCFKVNGKAFISFFEECMVFKLNGAAHSEALALKGAVQFDPSGKGRAMKEWVQVPAAQKDHWPELARAAHAYVKANS
jgi:hypothetical protein